MVTKLYNSNFDKTQNTQMVTKQKNWKMTKFKTSIHDKPKNTNCENIFFQITKLNNLILKKLKNLSGDTTQEVKLWQKSIYDNLTPWQQMRCTLCSVLQSYHVLQSAEVSWWRDCYQWGLPSLVLKPFLIKKGVDTHYFFILACSGLILII